ncbi:MAG: hypothetical protein Tsb0013_07900 [Phycisphaerales bacterium]
MRVPVSIRSVGGVLTRLLPALLITACVHTVHAQAFVFPADDPDLRERIDAVLDERRPLVDRITPADGAGVIDELHELYSRALELAPGLGAILARDLSRAYDAIGDPDSGRRWMARSSELVNQEPSVRGYDRKRQQQAAYAEISASMNRAQQLQQQGDLKAAANEFAFASALLASAPEGAVPPYLAYQLEFQNALLLEKLGRRDDAWGAFVEAGHHLARTEHFQTSEGVMLAVFELESSPHARASSEVYRDGLEAIYASVDFADVPDRISIVGNRILLEAFNAGDFETIEWIAQDTFREVARFEDTLGKKEVERLELHKSYISAASVLAGFYAMDNRLLDAAATLEHALHAYPDAENIFIERRMLRKHYEQLGMLPDERTGIFAGPMSLDEYFHVQRGGTLPTSWDEQIGSVPPPRPVEAFGISDFTQRQEQGGAVPVTSTVPRRGVLMPAIIIAAIAMLALAGVVWRRKAA